MIRDRMDQAFARALEARYTELVTASTPVGPARGFAGTRGTRLGPVGVTVAVAVVVIIGAVLAIRVGQQAAPPAVAPTSTGAHKGRTLSAEALAAKLPNQPDGQTIHTWTDHDVSDTSGPFSFIGRTAVIAAICDGGGAIMITDTSGSPHRENCNFLDVQQPFAKFNLGGDGKSTKTTGPVHVTVKVLSGTPQYIVRLWAVDPRILDANTVSVASTSAAVPSSLRTCAAADIAPTGTVAPVTGTTSGIVTITNRATTDCAIRTWPTMQYLAPNGSTIGPLQGKDNNGKSTHSSEGAIDKYGQFPPARLHARGNAYVVVALVTEQTLQKQDADLRSAPAPTPTNGPTFRPIPACNPKQVGSIRLTIGAATVNVPTPTHLDIAACTVSNARAFGVDPVVTKRPIIRP